MHPGAGRADRTLVNFLLDRFPEIATVGHPRRPGVVHRLDLGTSGVLAVARTEQAYQRLTRAFAERRGGQALSRDRLRAPRSAERRDRRRHRPRSQGSQADDGEGGARPRRAHALPHHRRRRRARRCSSSICAPVAPTRSGCTSRVAGSPSSAIRCTARRAGARFRRSVASVCDRSRDPPSTPGGSPCPTPPPERRSPSKRRCRRTFVGSGSKSPGASWRCRSLAPSGRPEWAAGCAGTATCARPTTASCGSRAPSARSARSAIYLCSTPRSPRVSEDLGARRVRRPRRQRSASGRAWYSPRPELARREQELTELAVRLPLRLRHRPAGERDRRRC